MRSILVLLASIVSLASCATPSQRSADAEVRRLCAIDGGTQVYETVTLPAERLDRESGIRIRSKDRATNSDEYYFEQEVVYLTKSEPKISRTIHRIIRRADGKVLGTAIWYARGGGDLPGPWHPSSFICPPISRGVPSVESLVFIKSGSK